MQPIAQDQQHQQGGEQPHPDAWREEGCAVAGVAETSGVTRHYTEALDLRERGRGREEEEWKREGEGRGGESWNSFTVGKVCSSWTEINSYSMA